MKLLRDDEVPSSPGVQSYQETQWSGLVVGVGLLGAAVAVVVWSVLSEARQSPWLIFLAFLSALVVALIGRFALRTFIASRRPESWRLRWDPDGLYVRYRSYLNDRFPADTPSVLYLTQREVDWLKAHEERLATPDERGNWTLTRKHRWLEIGLRNVDLTPVREALAAEGRLRSLRGARVNDFPLSVTGDATLRVQLNRPDRVTDLLQLYFSVDLPEKHRSPDFEKASMAEKKEHVLALAAAGDTFAAIKAAREVYGLDLERAKAFVKDLQGRGDSAGSAAEREK